MKRFMTIKEYCEESGFPEKLMHRLCRTDKGKKFAHRASSCNNAQYVLTVPIFEKMWDADEFRECL